MSPESARNRHLSGWDDPRSQCCRLELSQNRPAARPCRSDRAKGMDTYSEARAGWIAGECPRTSMFQNSRTVPRRSRVPVTSPRPKSDSCSMRSSVSSGAPSAENPVAPILDEKTSNPWASLNCHAPRRSHENTPHSVARHDRLPLRWAAVSGISQFGSMSAADSGGSGASMRPRRSRKTSGASASIWP